MAAQDFTGSDSGSINQKLNPSVMTFVTSNPTAFKQVDAALQRIAEAGAEAGTADDADWTHVYRAIRDAHCAVGTAS